MQKWHNNNDSTAWTVLAVQKFDRMTDTVNTEWPPIGTQNDRTSTPQ